MTKAETARLLTLIAAFDRRTIGETDVEAWSLVIGDLDANDCAEAVKQHFTDSREWLMPADVRRLALGAQRRREGQRKIAERDAEIAAENGEPEVKAITAGGPAPAVWTEMQRQVAIARAERKRRESEAEAARKEHAAARSAARAEVEEMAKNG